MNWWHFGGVVMVIFLATLQGRAGRIGPFWLIVLALPSTILHELAHFLVALVTGGRPTGFSIIPRAREVAIAGVQRKVWVLGSVNFAPTNISAFPTAIAPLFFLPLGAVLFQRWFAWFPATVASVAGLYFSVYLLVSASVLSWQDIKVALSHPVSLAGYLGGAAFVFWFYDDLRPLLAFVGHG